EYAEDYVSPYNDLGKKAFFNPEGWTVSAHHYYDKDQMRLYKGTGASEYREHTVLANGNIMVVDSLGAEVYVFNPSGKHLVTKRPLTGSVKYTFSYNGTSDKLVEIEDSFGNETDFVRDGSGILTEVHAPY